MRRLYLSLLLLPGICPAQDHEERCITLSKIYELINQEHFKPRQVDDSLAVFVFDEFMDMLDTNRLIITKDEYKALLPLRLKIDDHIRNVNCTFINDFISVYTNGLSRQKSIIEKLQAHPFNYNTTDSVRFSKSKFAFDLPAEELEYVWNKRLRYEILEDVSKMSNNLDSLAAVFQSLERTAREKVFETNLCRVNSSLNRSPDISSQLWNAFMNIFCNYFDPHTNFFSEDTKSNFISSLSTSNLSLGISVSLNEQEEIVIEDIIPGGPAALTQKIDKHDVIISVSDQNGNEHRVSCESFELVGEFLFSDLNTVLGLTLRKLNGTLLKVSVEKVVMPANENSVSALVVEHEGTRAGYIALPNFYSSFEPDSSAGCAEDIASEIDKLRRQKIDGLIIDLQGNGGGSMDEAIRLAGMFVEGGPLSLLVDRYGRQLILNDMNPGLVYDGPLVILIDGTSASASEFFASAMQDYGRAVIAGSPSLGKASMQTIAGLDGEYSQNFVKLTVQKFYRITGKSAQITGVIPDIRYPFLFEDIVHRESKDRNALTQNSIQSNALYSRFYQPNILKAIYAGKKRAESSAVMKNLRALNTKINTSYNVPSKLVRLTFADVFAHRHEGDALWEELKVKFETESEATVISLPTQSELSDDVVMDVATYQRIQDARTNPYLEELIMIIRDLAGK